MYLSGRMREENIGTMVIATNTDARRVVETTTARGVVICPIKPPIYKRGRNTTIFVKVDADIAVHTSEVPFIAASFLPSPSSLCLNIFSITTIEASTSIPTPRAIPARVIMFRVYPKAYITVNVIITESGMESETTKVGRRFKRNINIITAASNAPRRAFQKVLDIAFTMKVPWSKVIRKSISGYMLLSSFIFLFTLLTTFTVFAPDSFFISIPTPSFPFILTYPSGSG